MARGDKGKRFELEMELTSSSASFILIHGDCLEKLKDIPGNSIDSIVTDPPYGILFMGKKWDYEVPSKEVFAEMLRVLKPGGHMLCACGTRTQHRMAQNIEDAGFEIRDIVTWLYGSGFPKSHNISKAIDKLAGADRVKVETGKTRPDIRANNYSNSDGKVGLPEYIEQAATPEAKQWDGWGTALKPACEFFTLARKPLDEKTVAKNVLKYGTGGINVDRCRVEGAFKSGWSQSGSKASENTSMSGANYERPPKPDNPQGRFPANLILDEESAKALDEQSGTLKSGHLKPIETKKKNQVYGKYNQANINEFKSNQGGASRFFYVAKASKRERNDGLEATKTATKHGARPCDWERQDWSKVNANHHPTVKPIKLMRYLCRLITPPKGTVLDPFNGSGSTGVAAIKEGFNYIGIEREAEYVEISKRRIENATRG